MRSAMSLTLTTLYNNFGKSGGLVAFNVHVDSAVLCH